MKKFLLVKDYEIKRIVIAYDEFVLPLSEGEQAIDVTMDKKAYKIGDEYGRPPGVLKRMMSKLGF